MAKLHNSSLVNMTADGTGHPGGDLANDPGEVPGRTGSPISKRQQVDSVPKRRPGEESPEHPWEDHTHIRDNPGALQRQRLG